MRGGVFIGRWSGDATRAAGGINSKSAMTVAPPGRGVDRDGDQGFRSARLSASCAPPLATDGRPAGAETASLGSSVARWWQADARDGRLPHRDHRNLRQCRRDLPHSPTSTDRSPTRGEPPMQPRNGCRTLAGPSKSCNPVSQITDPAGRRIPAAYDSWLGGVQCGGRPDVFARGRRLRVGTSSGCINQGRRRSRTGVAWR